MTKKVVLLFSLAFLISCSSQETEILTDEELRAKKQAVEDLLVKYEVQDVIRASDNLEDYRDVSLERYERELKVALGVFKERIQRQKEQLKKEEEMARVMPEYLEKLKKAETEEERRAIAEEYKDVLNIHFADEPEKN